MNDILKIGRIPIMKGEYVIGVSYEKLWQVTYLGSTYQSKIDNNTSAPAQKINDIVSHINTDKWLCIADATNAVNSENDLNAEIVRAKAVEQEITEEISDVIHSDVIETIDYDGSVDGQQVSKLRQELNTEKQRALLAEQENTNVITGHINNNSNPHNITKTQLGLSNVDNTSDADKPISKAAQTALNDKANKSTTLEGYGITDAISATEKGVASGIATLDKDGKIPTSQLPSYVSDVLEYSSLSSFPSEGESGKIYVTKDTNKTYRWSGSTYVVISETLALGETSNTAYSGDKGKTNAEAITKILNGTTTVPSANNASKVNNLTVETAVPKNAVFSDTTDLASMTDDSTHRLVTDTEKSTWNGKWNYNEETVKAVKVNNAVNADTVGNHTVEKDIPSDAVLDGYTKEEINTKLSTLEEKISYYSTVKTID